MNFRIIEPTQQQEEVEYKLFKKYYKNRLDLTIRKYKRHYKSDHQNGGDSQEDLRRRKKS